MRALRMFGILALTAAGLLAAGFAFGRWQSARTEARHPPAGVFQPVVGGRLHVIDKPGPTPDAPILVLLHGASGNAADMMLAIGNGLTATHRVIAPDRPGHGWSDRPGGRAASSPARQAELIAQALKARGVNRAVVVGHSWAGSLATALALGFPELVSGLVLVAPATHPWPGGVDLNYHLATAPVFGSVFNHALVPPLGALILEPAASSVFRPQMGPSDYVDLIGAALVLRPANFRANAEDVYDLKPFLALQSQRYSEISAPVAILHGDADNTVWLDIHSRALAREIPGARLTVLPGAGHMIHHTHTAAVLTAIADVESRVRAHGG